jgi:tRNA-2-methylthio-N6-dimethylallyladenosine synthase
MSNGAPTLSKVKKLFIKTYGCQMNVYDSGRMADLLEPFGFSISDKIDGADMVILNTCHIREKAADKVYSELGRMRELKEEKKANGSNMIIAVAGCVGQAEGEEIFRRAPCVDIVVGPQSYQNLPELITKVARGGKMAIDLDFPTISKFDQLPQQVGPAGVSAFLSVQEGCNEFCKFCVVPYTRGEEYSRPLADVYREAVALTVAGAKEITLLGQNVNAYNGLGENGAQINLGQLIRQLAKIESVQRIRYTTSHPRSMHEDLIDAHGTVEKLMPFLHLPIQSGSDHILKEMNRKHTRAEYLQTIEKLKKSRPDMAFSSDFIVGYPGETDQDFQQTLKIVEEVGYAQCYSFKYSPRPGTPASIATKQVPEQVKAERLAVLQALIGKYQQQFNRNSIGSTMEVLLDKDGKYEQQIVGKSPYMQSVHLNAPKGYQGQIVKVKIEHLTSNSLSGTLI